ncbi:MAG: hypothetical protein Q9218_007902 [Villophora microphyllina]
MARQINKSNMAKTRARKRCSAVQIFEDVLNPPLKQATFPYRRHHSARPTTPSTTPASISRQQTLTQITPCLSRPFSNHEDNDELYDLEYDTLPAAMPPRKRQRKSTKRKADQQTITQMDPFRPQYHHGEDLEEIGDEYSEHTPDRTKRKRRKTTSTTPIARTIQTRSAKKQGAETGAKAEVKSPVITHESNKENVDQGPTLALLNDATIRMPPPKTPKTTRRKEIPSSQSPAETPLSIQTQRKRQGLALAPLNERSTNTPSRKFLSTRRKAAHPAPKLEVANSTGLEDEDSEMSFPLISQHDTTADAALQFSSLRPEDLPRSSLPCTPSKRKGIDEGKNASSLVSSIGGQDRPTLKRKGTVADSDEEEISPVRPSPTPPDMSQTGGSTAQHHPMADLGDVEQSSSSISTNSNATQPTQTPNSAGRTNSLFETVPTQLLSQPAKRPMSEQATPVYAYSNTPQRTQNYSPLPDSEGTPAPMILQSPQSSTPVHAPQPPALETESQFEDAWRQYTPSPPPEDLETPEYINERANASHGYEAPQHIEVHESQDYEDSEPIDLGTTQFLPPPLPFPLPSPERPNTSTDSIALPPVPPSQATTTDEMTQSSPHRSQWQYQSFPQRPQYQRQSSTISLTTEHLPSSPPAQREIPLSLSPVLSRKKVEAARTEEMGREDTAADDPYGEYEGWNGVRMTDSQLLPASLLDDCLEMPEVEEELLREMDL